uniref:Protein GVQW3 isoform X2 n=1 Tax=Camelus bactrianus TaxID=9837 RepID=A0A9W3HBB9_CAMBA|nr:protein GVQW3 isoform X2 [Camelus bactrianus]
MHPGARGCPLFPQPSFPAPSFPPTSARAGTRKEARLLGCGEAEAGPGVGCRSAPAHGLPRMGGNGACGRVSRDSTAGEPPAPPGIIPMKGGSRTFWSLCAQGGMLFWEDPKESLQFQPAPQSGPESLPYQILANAVPVASPFS